jgi:uncharacterized membrane protein YdbT with pleckstrin-like domain
MTKDLLPGENLILTDHPHWIVPIRTLWIPVVLVIAVGIADFTFLYDNYVPHLRLILSLGVIALAILWFIVVYIRWQSTAYTLTDQRIKIETGVFGRQSKIIPIDRIQDCTTKQSLIGRMMGYGRVEVDAAGAQGAEVLAYLPNPGTFRDQVFVQSERRRGGSAATPSAPANPSGV